MSYGCLHRFCGRLLICAVCLGVLNTLETVQGDDPSLVNPPVVDPNVAEQVAEVDQEEQQKKLEAIESAVRLGRESKEGVEVVRRGLTDRDESVREAAVGAIPAIGGKIEELLPFLNDKSDSVRFAAARDPGREWRH